jgi:hypothetical protein
VQLLCVCRRVTLTRLQVAALCATALPKTVVLLRRRGG